MDKKLIIVAIFCSNFIFGQKQLKLEQCTKLESSFVTNDSSFIYSLKKISEMQIVIHTRASETFEINDTIHRDFIQSDKKILALDRLYGLNQADYTGSYDLMDCYFVENSNHSFCILSFVDVFVLGSDQQVFFVVMKQAGNKWEYYCSYENKLNGPMDDIHIIRKKHRIKLRGKYLKRIKSV